MGRGELLPRLQFQDWLAVAMVAGAVAGLVVLLVERIRAEPTPEERAVFWAIFHSPPGTIGAVVVTRNGKPEVIATVRSVEEYLKLAGYGNVTPSKSSAPPSASWLHHFRAKVLRAASSSGIPPPPGRAAERLRAVGGEPQPGLAPWAVRARVVDVYQPGARMQ
jgi:hypothetical protein